MSILNLRHTFVALDLDRTLFRTDLFVELLLEAARTYITDEQRAVLQARADVNRGKLFDITGALREEGAELSVIAEDAIKSAAKRSVLFDHVPQVLEWLDEQGIAWGIVTYGAHDRQEVKLRMVTQQLRRNVAAYITDEGHKPALLQTWRHADGGFVPPASINPSVTRYQRIVMVDDKQSNMPTDEKGQLGIRIDNTSHTTKIARLPELLVKIVA